MNDGKIPSSADGSIPRQSLVSETDFYGPVVIEVALLLCTQRVGERYPVGPP